MRSKRVVLLTNHSLLASGVERLLQAVNGMNLSIVSVRDPEALPGLKRLAPEVIVVDSGDSSIAQGLITEMLREHPRARVVALNLDRKGIEVYRMRRVLQTDLSGLLDAIQGKGQQSTEKVAHTTGKSIDLGDGGETMGA
ncbi:MAG: hypothetical protein HYU29_07565 [Chloroflexi bacterium]|nr:hypothetical protein [Chloroflexota bacterium]